MHRIKIGALFIALLLSLGGCGVKLSPAAALERMAEAMSQVNQVEMAGQLQLAGTTETAIFNGLRDLAADFTGKIDVANLDALYYTLDLTLTGQGEEGNTKVGGELRGLPDYTYFRVREAVTPPNSPLALTADDRWYKIKNPDDGAGDVLGSGRRLTEAEGLRIRELIKSSRLFSAQTVLSPETVKGARTYHFTAVLERGALSSWLDALQIILGDKLKFDREAMMKLADNYTYDLWISQRDYRLVKIIARENFSADGKPQATLELDLFHFDSPVNIAVPSEVQEFTLESLLRSPLGQL